MNDRQRWEVRGRDVSQYPRWQNVLWWTLMVFNALFWIAVAYAAVHFIRKYW